MCKWLFVGVEWVSSYLSGSVPFTLPRFDGSKSAALGNPSLETPSIVGFRRWSVISFRAPLMQMAAVARK